MNYSVILFILAAHPFLKNKMVCQKLNQRSKLKNLKSFKDKHERKTYCRTFIAFNKTNCTVNENSTSTSVNSAVRTNTKPSQTWFWSLPQWNVEEFVFFIPIQHQYQSISSIYLKEHTTQAKSLTFLLPVDHLL